MIKESLPHVLVVDDDQRLRDLLRNYLSAQGFVVVTANDVADARKKLIFFEVDGLVLDVMMPGENGFDFVKGLRANSNPIPVLLLTAMGEAQDRITGLEYGADDYLSKPFEPRELVLRLNNMLRRQPYNEAAVVHTEVVPASLLFLGDFQFDVKRGELWRHDEVMHLTAGESQLLALLAAQPGEIISRESLAVQTGEGNTPRSVDVQIMRLRRKIEVDPRQPRYLQTVRGQGYMLLPD